MLKLKLGSQSFTAPSFPAAVSREAFTIHRDALEMQKSIGTIESAAAAKDLDALTTIMDMSLELRNRKSALVCKAYGGKFDIDELEQHLTDDQIDEQVQLISAKLNRTLAKK